MSSLQKVNLGTPPKAEDGDPVRTANVKANENVDVLNAQSALTSAAQLVDSPQTLTADLHLGRRVNISLAAAGVVQMPDAASCGADGVVLLRNIGTTIATLASKTGSGDSVALSKLNPGETALMDTDGVHAWAVLMRGRTNLDNEAVSGNLTVGGNLSVTGPVRFSGDTNLAYTAGSQRGVNWAVGASLRWQLISDGAAEEGANAGSNLAFARYTDAGVYIDNPLSVNRATGVFAFGKRPTFNGNTPWDSANLPGTVTAGVLNFGARPTFAGNTPYDTGNLVSPATVGGNQSFSGINVFQKFLTISAGFTNTFTSAPLFLNSPNTATGIGFASNSGAQGGQLFFSASTSGFAFVNYNNSGYAPLIVSTLTQGSDVRWKTDVETIVGAMAALRKFRGVRYTMDGKREVGVIAQEVAPVFPELVVELDHGHAGPPDPNGKPFLGVKYQNMVAPLLQGLLETDAALQKALARLDALEHKQ